jgi:enterobactin synthetase component D
MNFIRLTSQFKTDSELNFSFCVFDKNYFTERSFIAHNIYLPSSLSSAGSKRKSEFLAGRIAAKKALLLAGADPGQVLIGKHRNPIWPSGLTGSISHTHSQAICCVTKSNLKKIIGIDLEQVMTDDIRESTRQLIYRDNELRLVNQELKNKNNSGTLIFSAKESLFKALFPFINIYFEFLDASIIELNESHFKIQLNRTLSKEFRYGGIFNGTYCLLNGRIFTIIHDEHLTPNTVNKLRQQILNLD